MRGPFWSAAWAFALASALLWPSRPVHSEEERVEQDDNGVISARYEVDEQGRKHGKFTAWFEDGTVRRRAFYKEGRLSGSCSDYGANGKLTLTCRYRAGVRHGSSRSYHPGGKLHIVSAYRAGRLHGKYTEKSPAGDTIEAAVYRDGAFHGKRTLHRNRRPVAVQEWTAGRLRRMNGVVTHPKSLESIRKTLLKILGDKRAFADHALARASYAPASGTQEEQIAAALARLRAYRFLVDVPWKDVVTTPERNRYAEAGAKLCKRIGHLDHTPGNPGMPEKEYAEAYTGTSSCNLSVGTTVEYSVDGYMDDSDPTNIAKVGHRSYCMSPQLQKTGFGFDGVYSAMWALDRSRSKVPDYEFVAFPPRGFTPVGFFGEHYAWSVSLSPRHFGPPVPGSVRVGVFPLDERAMPAAESLEIDSFYVLQDGRGIPYMVIFRPQGIDVFPGRRYWVKISGLDGRKTRTLHYLVEFCSLEQRREEGGE